MTSFFDANTRRSRVSRSLEKGPFEQVEGFPNEVQA